MSIKYMPFTPEAFAPLVDHARAWFELFYDVSTHRQQYQREIATDGIALMLQMRAWRLRN
ncbi:MAG: hypothetical protein JO166_00525 [Deltaproteobacteria bacterium]|nr:hypothetical protein [Deltaproteobacteria bacterium]